ncbi:MAG: methyl-accepting chemotaxis protein, partial [Deltaproteobacteria bacterium]|nr:methyl-accepting chemotaxis protein [Candidatus Anaeroferrophillacea bacterium]
MMIARGGWNPAAMVRQLAVGLRLVSRERATVATTTDGSLAVLGTALTAACAAVETNFLHIGSELQDVYRHTMELRNLVTAAVGHIGGTEDGGVPARLCAVAEDATAELAAIEREVKEKSGCMDTIGATFKKLDRAAAETHKVARILGIIGMNIGVEGARSREAHELFSVVADNTRSLAAKLAGLADANHEVITRALRHQQEVAEHVTAGLTDIHRLGDHARETMAAAVQESETLVGTLMQVAGKAGGCAGDITRKVGELVMGVQLHDRMSQRVAHIVEILADRKDDHISPLLLQLQAAQLEEVIAEVRTCHRQATESLGAIGAAVRTLLGDLERLSRAGTAEFSHPVPGGDDPFAGLKASSILLNDTLERGERLVVPLRKAILQAAQNIRQVSGRVSEVRTIGQETHLMALNAIVKSAHLQENGGPLEVLAQEVKRSSDVSTATVSRIDDLVAVVENLARKLDESETAAAVARHRGMHDTRLEELTAAYDRFTSGFAAAFNLAQSLLKTTVELHTEVDFLPALADRF